MSDKNIDKDIKVLKEIAEAIWCDGDVYLTENHKQAIENVIATLKKLEIVNCKILEEKVKIITRNRKIIDNLKSELETYKKIAEKLADKLEFHYDYDYVCFIKGDYGQCREKKENSKTCKDCIIDWARNEVEKDV